MIGWRQTGKRLAPGILLGAFLCQGLVAVVHMSATGDETHYLGVGLHLMKEQEWTLDDSLAHPPLSYYLHSLPLLLAGIEAEAFEEPDANQRGRALMARYPDDRLIILARIPMLLLGVLLGVIIYRWVRDEYGAATARLSLFFFAFCPVMVAHSSLITPDICLTFFTVLTFYRLWIFLKTGRPSTLVTAGLALGAALLSKFTALLVVLILPLLLLLPPVRPGPPASGRLRLHHLGVVFLIAILAVNVGYFFSGSFRTLGDVPYKSGLFQSVQASGLLNWIPSPFPEAYVRGLDWQYTVVEGGFNYFLLGERSQQGWLHYYLVAFLLKTPLPFLFLLAMGVWLALRRTPDALQRLVLVPAVLFPLFFSLIKLSRGIRYVLPVYPLLCVALAPLLLWWIEQPRPHYRRLLAILLLWSVASGLWVSPHYLAYFNELAGGPSQGYRYLYESDFDWGQELKGLARYMKQRQIPSIKLAYFGTADPSHYGIDYELLPCGPARPQQGLLAVSSTALQFWGCFDWLREYRPVDRVGYTIFIYQAEGESTDSLP